MSIRRGAFWDNERGGLPPVCLESCEAIWEEAMQASGDYDVMHECADGDLEYGGTMLQGAPGSTQRTIGVLTMCLTHNYDGFSESYDFDCPNA